MTLMALGGAGVLAARRLGVGRRMERLVRARVLGIADHGLGSMTHAEVETPAPRFEVTSPGTTRDVTPVGGAPAFDVQLELESIEGAPAQPTPQEQDAAAEAELRERWER